MPDYTWKSLDAGIAELRRRAFERACLQQAIPPWDNVERDPEQNTEMARLDRFFDGVPGLFEPFRTMPGPEAFDPLKAQIVNAAQFLTTTQNAPSPVFELPGEPRVEYAGATTASDYLTDWSGRAARQFKTTYLDPLPIQLNGQFNLVSAGHRMMVAEAELWRMARDDVAQIVNGGINAIDQLSGFCDKNGWTVTLTTVAAIATIAAVPIAQAALPLAIVDGVASVAATLLKDDPPHTGTYHGNTAEKVIAEVGRALQDLADRINAQEAKIGLFLSNAAALLNGPHRGTFVPARPLLAETTASNYADDQHLGGVGRR
ncbi:hypothetical protein [Actinoplanes regularis]|uniref:hypothetical protein n=1 Tax=Actinoplanes regularis TaxID=52697 RepID=UPI0024A4230F|nr:hypothetical protein [Actinoplanes regularis]GLW31177.1 hypothetical protein Areg01_41170 [Actinoplanes regularis]